MGKWGYFAAGLFSAFGLLMLVALFNIVGPSPNIVQRQASYSEFLGKLSDGSIASASIRGNLVMATTKKGEKFGILVFSPERVADKLVEKGAEVWVGPEDIAPPSLLGVLINWFPFIVFVAAFWFAMGLPLYRMSATLRQYGYSAKKE
jgi:cell division protease FtsH